MDGAEGQLKTVGARSFGRQLPGFLEQCLHAEDSQRAKHVQPFPAILNEPDLTQLRQVLRDVRLALVEAGFHVADARLSFCLQNLDDLQTDWVCEGFEDLCGQRIPFHNLLHLIFNIRNI